MKTHIAARTDALQRGMCNYSYGNIENRQMTVNNSMPEINNTKSHSLRGWQVPFGIGVFLTIASGIAYFVAFPPVDAKTERAAKLMGSDPRDLQKVTRLNDSVRESVASYSEISNKDWRDLVTAFNSKDENIQNEATSAMMFLGNSSHRDEILKMVRPRLNAENVFVQLNALTLLRRFNDSSWRTEAEKRSVSTDKDLSEVATGMLEAGDIK